MNAAIIVLVLVFLVLLISGTPIFVSIAVATLVGVIIGTGVDSLVVIQSMVEGVNSFVLLAVPGFILAGAIMNASGITRRLVDFADALVGRFKGGLGHVNVVTSMIMAGVSGSAVSDAATTSVVLIPAMVKAGYPKAFSAAITAASSTIGPIIPPSAMFILFGAITSVSVGRLFVAGAIPGVLMGLLLMAATAIIAKRRNFPVGKRAGIKGMVLATKNNFFALIMPFIIIGGLVIGVFTPTEAAGIAVFLSVVVGGVIYRQLKLAEVPRILKDAAITSGTILILVAAANALSWIVAYLQISKILTAFFTSISSNPLVILVLLNVLLLVLGCLMDIIALLMILTPILMPVITALKIDPVHFGVVFVLNLMIGLITPPVGLVMYVTCGIADVQMGDYIADMWLFWIALVLLLFSISAFPGIVLWLPSVIFR